MVDRPTNEIELDTLLKSAGQSFTDAQKALLSNLNVSANMILSNAELELKVAVSSDAEGKISIRPISSEDIARGGIDSGMLSTLKMTFVSSIDEIKVEAPAVKPDSSGTLTNPVPALTGKKLNEAVRILKSAGWKFETHAAGKEEVAAAGKENLGRVIRQQPPAKQAVNKANTVVHLWVDLGNVPVREIDGIAEKLAGGLSKIGINTVGELGLADASKVASSLKISEIRAHAFVDMAMFMSQLIILGFKDEVVELLVKGAGICSLEQLATTSPEDITSSFREAIDSRKVRVPRNFKFTTEEIETWIKAAEVYLRNV